jgi:hypothetical protein
LAVELDVDFASVEEGRKNRSGSQAVAVVAFGLLRLIPKWDRKAMVSASPGPQVTAEGLDDALGALWPGQAIRGIGKLSREDRVAFGRFLDAAPDELLRAIAAAMRSDDHLAKYEAFRHAAAGIRQHMEDAAKAQLEGES